MQNKESFGAAMASTETEVQPKLKLAAMHERLEEEIFESFTPEQQIEIRDKLKVLSSLGYFIGKDFDIPIYLNEPGEGWYWATEENYIKVDPLDILDKPMDYLRFVICHEGGHRRISRTEFIPKETWHQEGFASMMNAIEDPRMNNFVAEVYPTYKGHMIFSYNHMEELNKKIEAEGKTKLGFVPKHELASFEYIRQWFREVQGQPFEIDQTLPQDVQEVVRATLADAQDSWWRYPSREEANSEETITEYAKISYHINHDKVWPHFKKLVDDDVETIKKLKALEQEKMKELEKGLSPEEKELLQNIREGKESGKLPDFLEKLIKEFINSLTDEEKQEFFEEVMKALREFDGYVNEVRSGKTNDKELSEKMKQEQPKSQGKSHEPSDEEQKELEYTRNKLQQIINKNKNIYESTIQEILPLIKDLEDDLRAIFVNRRSKKWETGFRFGKKIDIKKRIQEKAKGVDAFESRAWQKREHPVEKDYAITILIDLSGSMRGPKIKEAFKAVTAFTEVLSKLGINIEVIGFNTKLHEYKSFDTELDDAVRGHMGSMIKETDSWNAMGNDDGWALTNASQRLSKQSQTEKFIFVLSDGEPAPHEHDQPEFELERVVKRIMSETDQKIIGLGIGSGTEHVEGYYPNSLANIDIKNLPQALSGVIKEAIANSDEF